MSQQEEPIEMYCVCGIQLRGWVRPRTAEDPVWVIVEPHKEVCSFIKREVEELDWPSEITG